MWKKFRSRTQASNQPTAGEDDAFASRTAVRRRRPVAHERPSDGDELSETQPTTLSSTIHDRGRSVPVRKRDSSEERCNDPLGLTVVHEPRTSRCADMIFVHGLGGASRQTWSKNKDPALFWPGKWLPFESGISGIRILSFGYNTRFMSTGPNSNTSILDFAKDLLFQMRSGRDEKGQSLDIGNVPIIFVVHSMGGLVVKKACILAKADPEYQKMMASLRAILFLSTPHRGTNLAAALNNILAVSIAHSSKAYVAELKRNSQTIADINEQFRHLTLDVQMVSFYETLRTSIGPKNIMVLEQDSSILGYPHEISGPMIADHHDVCKYSSPEDPNYIRVRNALGMLVTRICEQRENQIIEAKEPIVEVPKGIDTLLGILETPESDHEFFFERWMPGTCEWILSHEAFSAWSQGSTHSSILWLHALPASGKSVLAAYLIHHLQELGVPCQYYFFRFGSHSSQSLGTLLRTLAFQIARQVPDFGQALQAMHGGGERLGTSGAHVIWQKLFVSKLFKIDSTTPLYWIVDAVDESNSPTLVLKLLSAISSSKFPIRVLVTSRYDTYMDSILNRTAHSMPVHRLVLSQDGTDISLYVGSEIQYLPGSPDFRDEVIMKILEKAKGNFLWVYLASRELLECHTQGDIQRVLEDVPTEMESMYRHMEDHVAKSNRPADVKLARTVLTWVTCSRRPLCLEEVSEALHPSFADFLDLNHTINHICGHFIVVDSKGVLSMIHQTAQDYIVKTASTKCRIDMGVGHQLLLSRCLLSFSDPTLRFLHENTTPKLVRYSATSWAYHLDHSLAGSAESMTMVVKFLQDYSVLVWIQYLASSNRLETLAHTSQALSLFVHKKRNDRIQVPTVNFEELEKLDLWASDLGRIVGKFGGNLLEDPLSIHGLVPLFCPTASAMYQRFGKEKAVPELTISGISNATWDDSVARLFLGNRLRPSAVLTSDRFFAVLIYGSAGTMVVYDAVGLKEKYCLKHSQDVVVLAFSSDSKMLVSCGVSTTKLWEVSTGRHLHSIPNPMNTKALCVKFSLDGSKILIASCDGHFRTLNIGAITKGWHVHDHRHETSEETVLPHLPSRGNFAFSPDGSQLAIASRSLPLEVWHVDDSSLVAKCQHTASGEQLKGSTGVKAVTWNPVTEEVLGVRVEGPIFKWHPLHKHYEELKACASEIACDSEGTFFATSDFECNIDIYDYQRFCRVYRLSSENPVVGLAFSPDCRRLYDIRGSLCNVWEPSILNRLRDTDPQGRETPQPTILPSMSSDPHVSMPEPILALAAPPEGDFCSAGDDEGVVYLFDDRTGRKHELWRSPSQMSIDHLVWSPDSKYLACVEVGGKMTVKSVLSPPAEIKNGKWTASPVFDTKTQIDSGGVSQILLDPSSQYLSVTSQTSTQVWSLETGLVTASLMAKTPGSPQRWFNHPLHEDRLISWTPTAFTTYLWSDLTELSTTRIEGKSDVTDAQPLSPLENSTRTERCTTTLDASHILLQTSHPSPNHTHTKETHIYDLHTFEPLILPTSILARVNIALNILPSQHFVFLDLNYWLCSFRLGSSVQRATKHFFLPKDWINPDSLALCTVAMDGAFLYPRNGEVAVIRWAVGG